MPDPPETKGARQGALRRQPQVAAHEGEPTQYSQGGKPNAKTLASDRWGEREVNRIRALDAGYRAVLEHTHGVDRSTVYAGKTALRP
jgi:hypothetical protein